MPVIIVEGPALPFDMKRKLVEEVTSVAREIYGGRTIAVLIHELSADNVGIEGKLVSELEKSVDDQMASG